MGADASKLLDPLPTVLLRRDAAERAPRALVAARRLRRSDDRSRGRSGLPGKIFMTRGCGEVARVCHAEGALAIHFEYDGVSTLFFKVFDAEGRRLECCPKEVVWGIIVARTSPANRFPSNSSGSSGGAGGSIDSAELHATPETSDDNYEPPRSRRARNKAAA